MKRYRCTPYRLLPFLLLPLLLSGCWFLSEDPESPEKEKAAQEQTVLPPEQKIGSIVFEEPEAPSHEEASQPPARKTEKKPPADARPQVAIIIDDMGYHRKIGQRLLELDINLTFSFLPLAPFTSELEALAYERGRDVMLHLPMEASDSRWDPGPGALFLAASPEELTATLKKDMASVPHAVGTNNHMGSKFTQNRQAMHTVLSEVKKQGLFFVDSFTTAKSTGMDEARKIGLKTNRRHVFLDNVQDPKKICRQLDKLVELATKQHQAIGIGHPYQATLDAFRGCEEKLLKTVQVVGAHEIVK